MRLVYSQEMTNVIILDTETTGLPPRGANPEDFASWDVCRIVQIAWELYSENGALLNSYCATVRPVGFKIPASSTAIHGISQRNALATGKELSEVLEDLNSALTNAEVAVAHNMRFDSDVLLAELHRAKRHDIIDKWNALRKDCTMLMTKPPGQRWMKLKDAYTKHLQKEPNVELHRADNDVSLCAKLYWRIKRGIAIAQLSNELDDM